MRFPWLAARTQHGICALAAAGAGMSLVDPCVAEDWSGGRAVFVPCEPAIHWDLAVVMPKARPPSLICQDFIEFLAERADAPVERRLEAAAHA